MFGKNPNLNNPATNLPEIKYQVGNVCIIIKETENEIFNYKKALPYTIFYTQDKSDPVFVQMISAQNREALSSAMKRNTVSLIKELKSLKLFATSDLAELLLSQGIKAQQDNEKNVESTLHRTKSC